MGQVTVTAAYYFPSLVLITSLPRPQSPALSLPHCPSPPPPHSSLAGLQTYQTFHASGACCSFFLQFFLQNIHDCLFLAFKLKYHFLREAFLLYFSHLPFHCSIQPSVHITLHSAFNKCLLSPYYCAWCRAYSSEENRWGPSITGLSCFLVNFVILSLPPIE